MLKSWESIPFEENYITFRGIQSGYVAFLGFKDFMIKLISSTVGLGKSNRDNVLKFSLILIKLGWFLWHRMVFWTVYSSWSEFDGFPTDSGTDPD